MTYQELIKCFEIVSVIYIGTVRLHVVLLLYLSVIGTVRVHVVLLIY